MTTIDDTASARARRAGYDRGQYIGGPAERLTREEIDAEKAAKPRPDLVPGSALLAMGAAMAYGYGKHGRCTWRTPGIEQAKAETHIASAWRHLSMMGPAYDALDVSGLPHLHHALAQLAIAVECMSAAPAISPDRLADGAELDRAGLLAEPADVPRYTVLPDAEIPARPWCLRTYYSDGMIGMQNLPTKADAIAAGEAWLKAQQPADETQEPGDHNAADREDGTIAVDSDGWLAVALDGQWYPTEADNRKPRELWYDATIVRDPSIALIRSLLPEGWSIERDCTTTATQGAFDLANPAGCRRETHDNPAALLAYALRNA